MRILLVVWALWVGVEARLGVRNATVSRGIDDGAKRIIEAALSQDTFVFDRLSYVTDTFGPRFSGTPALEAAIDHIVKTLQADGLHARTEPVANVPKWVRGNEYARMVAPSAREKRLNMVGLGMSIGTPNGAPLVASVLVVQSFADLAERCNEASGKIVVWNVQWEGYGRTVIYRRTGATEAAKCGAVASMVRSITPYSLTSPHTGNSDTASIPSAALSIEDALLMQRMQNRNQPITVELYMEAHLDGVVTSRNIVAEIKGSEFPDEVVVLGGHLDSWDNADGFADDGSGFAISFEGLRLIHSLGLQPRRTIRAVGWTNEENGMRGAAQYAADHAHELPSMSMAIESDGGCWVTFRLGCRVSAAAEAILVPLGSELLGPIGSGNVSNDGSGGADIEPMCSQGVPCGAHKTLDPRSSPAGFPENPAAGYTTNNPNSGNGYFFYHHTEADTPDKTWPAHLQHGAAFMGVWGWALGNLDAPLPRG